MLPVLLVGLGILCAWLASDVSPILAFSLIAAFPLVWKTLQKSDAGLLVLVYAMLLSPELKLFDVPEREVSIRVDDILLALIFVAWFLRQALAHGTAPIRQTPLFWPFIAYASVAVFSSAYGIMDGRLLPLQCALFLFKYLEYFFLYIMVANIIDDEDQAKRFMKAACITAVLVVAYGYAQIPYRGLGGRLSTPFETALNAPVKTSEANTLGGYMLIVFAMAFAYFTREGVTPRRRFFLIVFMAAAFPVFLLTLSRGSYLAFIPMALVSLILAQRGRKTLAALFALGLLVFTFNSTLSRSVKNRIEYTTAQGTERFVIMGVAFIVDPSTATRLYKWREAFHVWLPRHPLVGHGVTGVKLVDSQYPRLLGETGLLGFMAFMWVLWEVFKLGLRRMRAASNIFESALAAGFLAALAGILTHAFSANTFVIIRVMEPFWFLAGMLTAIEKQTFSSAAEAPAPAPVPQAPGLSSGPALV